MGWVGPEVLEELGIKAEIVAPMRVILDQQEVVAQAVPMALALMAEPQMSRVLKQVLVVEAALTEVQ